MLKRFYITLWLVGVFSSCSIYKIQQQTYTLTMADGSTRIGGKSKRAIKSDSYNFYNRWDFIKYEYYADGTLKNKSISHFKSATYGRPCNELIYQFETYDSTGQITEEIKDVCDCKKSIVKTYDAGKLVSKKVKRRE